MDDFQKSFQELKRKQATKVIDMEKVETEELDVLDQQLFNEEGNLKRTVILKLR